MRGHPAFVREAEGAWKEIRYHKLGTPLKNCLWATPCLPSRPVIAASCSDCFKSGYLELCLFWQIWCSRGEVLFPSMLYACHRSEISMGGIAEMSCFRRVLGSLQLSCVTIRNIKLFNRAFILEDTGPCWISRWTEAVS